MPVNFTKFPDGKTEKYYYLARKLFLKKIGEGKYYPTFDNIHVLASIFYHLENAYTKELPDDPELRLIELFRGNGIKQLLEIGTKANLGFTRMMNDIVRKVGGAMSVIDLSPSAESARRSGIKVVIGDARELRKHFPDKRFDLIFNSGVLSYGGVGDMAPTTEGEFFSDGSDLLAELLNGLSDLPKAAVIANGMRSHLILERERVESVANIIVWDNAIARHDYYVQSLDARYQSNSRMNELRMSGANAIIVQNKRPRVLIKTGFRGRRSEARSQPVEIFLGSWESRSDFPGDWKYDQFEEMVKELRSLGVKTEIRNQDDGFAEMGSTHYATNYYKAYLVIDRRDEAFVNAYLSKRASGKFEKDNFVTEYIEALAGEEGHKEIAVIVDETFAAIYKVMKNANPNFNQLALYQIYKEFVEAKEAGKLKHEKTEAGKFLLGDIPYLLSDDYFEPYVIRLDDHPLVTTLRDVFKISEASVEQNRHAVSYMGRHFFVVAGQEYLTVPPSLEPFVEMFLNAGTDAMLEALKSPLALTKTGESQKVLEEAPLTPESIEKQLAELGVQAAKVDARFLSILRTARMINPNFDLKLIYEIYLKHKEQFAKPTHSKDGHFRIFYLESYWHTDEGDNEIPEYFPVLSVPESNKWFIEKREDDPQALYLRDQFKISGAYVEIEQGHFTDQSFRHYLGHDQYARKLFVPSEHGAFVELYQLAGDQEVRNALELPVIDPKTEVDLGIRVLGKGLRSPNLGNKEAGFLLFEQLGLPYPPGIVLSEKLVRSILEKSIFDKDFMRANQYISLINERLKDLNIKNKVSVRSNPKKSMPGILKTVGNTFELRNAIKAVGWAWYSDKAIAYRKREAMSDEYDLPIIIQKWVSGRGPSGALYASGVFSTRNPNTGADGLFGQYLENAAGEELMTSGKAGKDIQELAQRAPEIFQQLL
ncbi:MAG: PEP/pyruvate-binding domain-containing protein, partial [Candidatus Taylorbacteria bacterium]|nr:PEP/pyruvate-binding domain-containing protein [Candidatus Taylorbacteria bacterium]